MSNIEVGLLGILWFHVRYSILNMCRHCRSLLVERARWAGTGVTKREEPHYSLRNDGDGAAAEIVSRNEGFWRDAACQPLKEGAFVWRVLD